MQSSSKLVKSLQNIVKVWIFHWFGMKTVICAFFSLFWSKEWEEIESLCVLIPLRMHWPGIEVAVANVHRGSKFYQNQWKNCRDIVFDNFFKLQHPQSWNFFKYDFWATVMLWIANMCHNAKFHQNWSNICKDIIKVWIFHWFGMKTVICAFFAVLG